MLPKTGEFRKAKFNGDISAPKPTPAKFLYVAAPTAPFIASPSHPGCCLRCRAMEARRRRDSGSKCLPRWSLTQEYW